MQKFRVASAEAQRLAMQIMHIVDEFRLTDGEKHDVSDGYDLADKANRLSLYRTLRTLEGRDYKAILGADTTLDKVKITRWRPDTCGCVVTYLWHKDHQEDGRVHYPHRSERQCKHHEHFEPHSNEHHSQITEECRHKEQARRFLAEHLEVDVSEIEWCHDEKRELVLDHPKVRNHGEARTRAERLLQGKLSDRPALLRTNQE